MRKQSSALLKSLVNPVNIGAASAGLASLVGGSVLNSKYIDSVVRPDETDFTPEAQADAEKMLQYIRDKGVNVEMVSSPIGAHYLAATNTIYMPEDEPLTAGTLAHEFGHSRTHDFARNKIGKLGALAHVLSTAAVPNTISQAAPLLTLGSLHAGKFRTAKNLGIINLLMQSPRLLEEAAASGIGQKTMLDLGIGNSADSWSGVPTYLTVASLPSLMAWTGSATNKLIRKGPKAFKPVAALAKLLAKA